MTGNGCCPAIGDKNHEHTHNRVLWFPEFHPEPEGTRDRDKHCTGLWDTMPRIIQEKEHYRR